MVNFPTRRNPRFNSLSQFHVYDEIGKGALSFVYLVTEKVTKTKYALKVIDIRSLPAEDHENIEKELAIHTRITHPNIVQLIDFFEEDDFVYLILEYCSKGNLFAYMNRKQQLPELTVKTIFNQVLSAVGYLHSQRIIMRDLKPENILLDRKGRVKLCDFGWASDLNDIVYRSIRAGTPAYMSPESLRSEPQDEKTDVWSLGVLLYELLYNKEPFKAHNDAQRLMLMKSRRIYFSNRAISKELKNTILICLMYDKNKRPFVSQLIHSNYYNEPDTQNKQGNRQRFYSTNEISRANSQYEDSNLYKLKAAPKHNDVKFVKQYSVRDVSIDPLTLKQNTVSTLRNIPVSLSMNNNNFKNNIKNIVKNIHEKEKDQLHYKSISNLSFNTIKSFDEVSLQNNLTIYDRNRKNSNFISPHSFHVLNGVSNQNNKNDSYHLLTNKTETDKDPYVVSKSVDKLNEMLHNKNPLIKGRINLIPLKPTEQKKPSANTINTKLKLEKKPNKSIWNKKPFNLHLRHDNKPIAKKDLFKTDNDINRYIKTKKNIPNSKLIFTNHYKAQYNQTIRTPKPKHIYNKAKDDFRDDQKYIKFSSEPNNFFNHKLIKSTKPVPNITSIKQTTNRQKRKNNFNVKSFFLTGQDFFRMSKGYKHTIPKKDERGIIQHIYRKAS